MDLNQNRGLDRLLTGFRTGEAARAVAKPVVDRAVFFGVDLGQRGSHSAVVALERFEVMPEYADVLRGAGPRRRFVVRQVERVGLGTPYSEVVMRVKRMVEQVVAMTGARVVLVVDESGVGVPVVEMMREVGLGGCCWLMPFVITSGQVATGSSVPRAELVTKMQLMAERGELEIAAGCRHGEELERELVHLQLGKGAESDDLALALALACWRAKVR